LPSIVGKRRGNQTCCYYLVESARVDGKHRIVSQQYLGTTDEAMAKLSGGEAGQPVQPRRSADGMTVVSKTTGIGVRLIAPLAPVARRHAVRLPECPAEVGGVGEAPPPADRRDRTGAFRRQGEFSAAVPP